MGMVISIEHLQPAQRPDQLSVLASDQAAADR
jgi:hypothetical protein